MDEMTAYRVKLDAFEGPLDLLLYLIRKNEVDIYDIPIAEITQQYLDMLKVMRTLDLDIAGDFLVMAATLTHIKSRMLLPTPPDGEAEEGGEDPRKELVDRLLEYERFKEAARSLASAEPISSQRRRRRSRPGSAGRPARHRPRSALRAR